MKAAARVRENAAIIRAGAAVVVVTVAIVLLTRAFDRVNALIPLTTWWSEVALRASLAVWVLAMVVPLLGARPRRRVWLSLVVSFTAALAAFAATRFIDPASIDTSAGVYATGVALAAGLTGVGAVAATVGILRATSPAALARRPHHWR